MPNTAYLKAPHFYDFFMRANIALKRQFVFIIIKQTNMAQLGLNSGHPGGDQGQKLDRVCWLRQMTNTYKLTETLFTCKNLHILYCRIMF